MNKIARTYLYLSVLLFFAIGVSSLFAPGMVAANLQLSPLSLAGTGEIRGLYGGGFFAFGLVLLGGLRCKSLSPGLLIAMATIMGGVVVGRIVSLAFDHEYLLTLIGGSAELLLALACWNVYKYDKAAP